MVGAPSRSSSPGEWSGHGQYGHSRSSQQTRALPQQGEYTAPYPANQTPAAAPANYSRSDDSVYQATEALNRQGLEFVNLVIGVDFTRSNGWTGGNSFAGRSLHAIGDTPNPYEETMSVTGRTLSPFGDNSIPCFGFGDVSTRDKEVFCFYPDQRPCNGLEEVLQRYRDLLPHLQFEGPTSFAPLIEMAMTIVEQSGGQHHVLLIITDGQVTNQDHRTLGAIANASKFPLSIVLVGVGDGPWDMMRELDDNIPARDFDNFQFVNFSEIMSENIPQSRKDARLALAAFSKLPQQYKAAMELGILGLRSSVAPGRVPLPPPIASLGAYMNRLESFGQTRIDVQNLSLATPPDLESVMAALAITTNSCEEQVCPICLANPQNMVFGCGHQGCGRCLNLCPFCRSPITTVVKLHCDETVEMGVPPLLESTYEYKVCPICLVNSKDMVFGCGHQICCDCGTSLESCPICRGPITTRIKLY